MVGGNKDDFISFYNLRGNVIPKNDGNIKPSMNDSILNKSLELIFIILIPREANLNGSNMENMIRDGECRERSKFDSTNFTFDEEDNKQTN